MRADKFLWCVRYYKTRSLAAKACLNGQVKINGIRSKPAKEIFEGDTVELRKNHIQYQMIVLAIPAARQAARLIPLFVKDISPERDTEELRALAPHINRKKGLGRPTKKERRNLENWQEEKVNFVTEEE